jgi:hypothetical protein
VLHLAVLQEGDSWAVAFHAAEDAVAFSLQVMSRGLCGFAAVLRRVSSARQQELTVMLVQVLLIVESVLKHVCGFA